MSRLLRANFARLFKSGIFWLCMAFSAGFSAFMVLMRYLDVKKNADEYAQLGESYANADGLIFTGGFYMIFAFAVFVGLFVGTEYSDGTMRNKLVIGHPRGAVYLANLAACTAADVMMYLSSAALTLLFGEIFINGTTLTAEELLKFALAGTAAVIALTALLVMFSMLIRSKAAGAVTALILTIILIFAALFLESRLNQPEYTGGFSYIDEESGTEVEVPYEKNSMYVTGAKRRAYEFLDDFLPVSQLYGIVKNEDDGLGVHAAYDAVILILATGAGMIVFRRSDLK